MRLFRKLVLVPAVVILALSVPGCNNAAAPAPASSPPRQSPASPSLTPPPSPSPSPTSPSPSPEPPVQGLGLLEPDKYYYMQGDPDSTGYVFLEDGFVFDNYGEEGQFELDGEVIVIRFDSGLIVNMRLIDEFTLLDTGSGTVYIREGGIGFGTSGPAASGYSQILFEAFYFLSGDEHELSFCFHDDGAVNIGTPAEWDEGTYTVNNDEITIVSEGRPIIILTVINLAELADLNNPPDVYAFKAAFAAELVAGDYYYIDGDIDSASLCFSADGQVKIEDPYGDSEIGLFTVDGEMVTIELGGETDVLYIVNSYILESVWGLLFIRFP